MLKKKKQSETCVSYFSFHFISFRASLVFFAMFAVSTVSRFCRVASLFRCKHTWTRKNCSLHVDRLASAWTQAWRVLTNDCCCWQWKVLINWNRTRSLSRWQIWLNFHISCWCIGFFVETNSNVMQLSRRYWTWSRTHRWSGKVLMSAHIFHFFPCSAFFRCLPFTFLAC